MRTVITLNALWRDVKALYTGEARFRKTVAAERPRTVSSGNLHRSITLICPAGSKGL